MARPILSLAPWTYRIRRKFGPGEADKNRDHPATITPRPTRLSRRGGPRRLAAPGTPGGLTRAAPPAARSSRAARPVMATGAARAVGLMEDYTRENGRGRPAQG